MNIRELQLALEEAIAGGLPYDTEVVIDADGMGEWITVTHLGDPVSAPEDYDLWFTLGFGTPADFRWTPGGLPHSEEIT